MGNQNGRSIFTDQDVTEFIETSGLDAVHVRDQFRRFMNNHPDGFMKPIDFRQMIKTAYPSVDATKLGKLVLRMYDTDNDGVVDFSEFMVVNNIMSCGTPEEVLERIFKAFDKNHDGMISKEEMERIVKKLYSVIKHDDPDAGPKEEIVDDAFSEMDKDENGEITLEEFTKACLEKGKTTKMLALKFINLFVEERDDN